MEIIEVLLVPGGRLGRARYFFCGILLAFLQSIASTVVGAMVGMSWLLHGGPGVPHVTEVASILAGLPFLYPTVVILTKRLADLGLSRRHAIWIMVVDYLPNALFPLHAGMVPVVLAVLVSIAVSAWLCLTPGSTDLDDGPVPIPLPGWMNRWRYALIQVAAFAPVLLLWGLVRVDAGSDGAAGSIHPLSHGMALMLVLFMGLFAIVGIAASFARLRDAGHSPLHLFWMVLLLGVSMATSEPYERGVLVMICWIVTPLWALSWLSLFLLPSARWVPSRILRARVAMVLLAAPIPTFILWSVLQMMFGDPVATFAARSGVLWLSYEQSHWALTSLVVGTLVLWVHLEWTRPWMQSLPRPSSARAQAAACLVAIVLLPLLDVVLVMLGDTFSGNGAKGATAPIAVAVGLVLVWQDFLIGGDDVVLRRPRHVEILDVVLLVVFVIASAQVPGYRIVNVAAVCLGCLFGWWRADALSRATGLTIPAIDAMAFGAAALLGLLALSVPLSMRHGDDRGALVVLLVFPTLRALSWLLRSAPRGDRVTFVAASVVILPVACLFVGRPVSGIFKVRTACDSRSCRFDINDGRTGRVFWFRQGPEGRVEVRPGVPPPERPSTAAAPPADP